MQKTIIKHLGIIPDGNRRWARRLGKKIGFGHKRGIESFRDVIEWCREINISELTLYTLSIQNFQREKMELDYLFYLIKKELHHWLTTDEAQEKGIYVRAIGRKRMLPKDIANDFKRLEEKTKNNKTMKVNFAIGYGGREEIIDAVKKTVKKKEKLTEENVRKNLWLSSYPELVIRTSGEYRTSNFLMWQSAYSEWYFTKKCWPEFDKKELLKAIRDFESRERRYGK